MDNIEKLKKWVEESERIVFFGGAGVSTESGIPDFRSVDGLYNQKFEYPPETIISHSFYLREPSYFFRFYREKMMPLGFEPNITHMKLAQWELEKVAEPEVKADILIRMMLKNLQKKQAFPVL